MGIVAALSGDLPSGLATALRVYVGLTGALILLVAVTTSISGFTRLAHSLGEHGQLPRAFGRLNRRTLVSPEAIVAAALISIALLVGTSFLTDEVTFLASLFSFGVLAAFTAAQLAVIKLRYTEPDLKRPYRAPFDVRIRGVGVPLPAIVGGLGTFAIFVIAMVTHAGARYGGPMLARRRARRLRARPLEARTQGLLERIEAPPEVLPEMEISSILVPMKLGLIGEEMVATAVKLAQERGAKVEALHVIRVPLDRSLEAELGGEDERAALSLDEARLLGDDHGVPVRGRDGPRALDRRGDRRRGEAPRRRPDRPRLGAALAPPVALLLAHGRVRAAQGPVRGARGRVPRGRHGGRRRPRVVS